MCKNVDPLQADIPLVYKHPTLNDLGQARAQDCAAEWVVLLSNNLKHEVGLFQTAHIHKNAHTHHKLLNGSH